MSSFSARLVQLLLSIFLCNHVRQYTMRVTALSTTHPNVAINKPTFQGPGTRSRSSTQDLDTYQSLRAVDGNNANDETACSQTTNSSASWWIVDLQALVNIHGAAILNTKDQLGQIPDFSMDVFEQDPRKDPDFPNIVGGTSCSVYFDPFSGSVTAWLDVDCGSSGTVSGRFVRLTKNTYGSLKLCEVQVYATLLTVETTFRPSAGMKSLADPQEDLGVFESPARCAVLVLARPSLDAFNYNTVTGQCKGRSSNSGLSFIRDEQWVNFEQVSGSPINPFGAPSTSFGGGGSFSGSSLTFSGGALFPV